MLLGWTLDTTLTLYMLNRVTGDVHGGIVKCWPVVAGTEWETDIRTMLALTH